MNEMPRLKKEYVDHVAGELQKELNLKSPMEVPRFAKVVLNVGIGDAVDNKEVIEVVSGELARISGQKPVRTYAKGAISSFQIRKGDVIGMKVTLRGRRMWEFIDKLINIVFPRTKDFRGFAVDGFDGSGNYTIGIQEQTVFPEIDPNQVTKLRGMEITMVTTTDSDERAKALLDKFGFPFRKDG